MYVSHLLTLFLYNYVLIFNYIVTQDRDYILQKIEMQKYIYV
jgi:hypothetical protein